MIVAYIEQDHRNWDLYLSEYRIAYNASKHAATGLNPAFLNFGREPLIKNSLIYELESGCDIKSGNEQDWAQRLFRLGAIRGWIVENLEAAHQRESRYYNRHHLPMTYNLNDKVFYRDYTKSSAAKNISAKLLKEYKDLIRLLKSYPLQFTI